MARLAVLLALGVLATACAHTRALLPSAQSEELQTDGATFIIQYEAEDAESARDVKAVLPPVVQLLRRWGEFAAPVTIRIHPSHDAFEAAIHHFNYPWLRAWARYDSIDLQSPRTWGLLSSLQAQIAELLSHEMTHCLMYQRAATATDWTSKEIPLWFREGMASVTAHQEYRRPHDEDVWRYLNTNPGKDPVQDADSIYQAEPDIVYGAAHQAFAFLDRRYGDAAVRQLLDRMKAGLDFAHAFRSSIGVSEEALAHEYLRSVRWEGWRGQPDSHITLPLVAPVGREGAHAARL